MAKVRVTCPSGLSAADEYTLWGLGATPVKLAMTATLIHRHRSPPLTAENPDSRSVFEFASFRTSRPSKFGLLEIMRFLRDFGSFH
jgi:hypothetical protein